MVWTPLVQWLDGAPTRDTLASPLRGWVLDPDPDPDQFDRGAAKPLVRPVTGCPDDGICKFRTLLDGIGDVFGLDGADHFCADVKCVRVHGVFRFAFRFDG